MDILVLDDDRSVLGAVERLLKVRGFNVETFSTVDSFIERANLREAACLVLDINLNGVCGIELKRKLTDMGISPPVIFITGRDEDVTRRAALSAGCVAYLSKPFSSPDLVAAALCLGSERGGRLAMSVGGRRHSDGRFTMFMIMPTR